MNAKQINRFWSSAGRIIDLAAKYSQRISLKESLLDESEEWKVRNVLDRYYDGDISNLNKSIKNAKKQFEREVMMYNLDCQHEGLKEVRKIETLLELLLDPQRRMFYKKAIKKAKEEQIVYPLQDIEKAFRESKKTNKNTTK